MRRYLEELPASAHTAASHASGAQRTSACAPSAHPNPRTPRRSRFSPAAAAALARTLASEARVETSRRNSRQATPARNRKLSYPTYHGDHEVGLDGSVHAPTRSHPHAREGERGVLGDCVVVVVVVQDPDVRCGRDRGDQQINQLDSV